MDILLNSFPTTVVTGLLAFLLFLYSLSWISRHVHQTSKKKRAVPDAGGARPLFGHLHLLRGPKPPHITLSDMADKYGSIFTIKMGIHRTLIMQFLFLRWLDIGGYEKAMKKTWKEIDQLLESWLKEHKQKRISGQVKGEHDFMDTMLSVLDDAEELPDYDADTINKATCLEASVSARATDTSTTERVVVAVRAEKVISKTALAWALTHVVHPGDGITLLAVFPAEKTGRRFWKFPRLTSDCKNSHVGKLPDRICEISESCSQMVLQFHNQIEVRVRIKVVSGASESVVANEARSNGTNWVVLDK
ncbi:hypothetical protein LWI29_027803 [Acer saccharum]|uniref:Uncharacterized protein n=1 Tax=Acer saccharum TaxID=4024 RepID=A0AA39RNM3_ACESA|nr:hypothetical protein LWI29_027803 [Acer saccharum]